ncbi:hypothetical protein [Amycolatopsis sp. H20-H5]|uniref:hypothetical protein n=1 Tax=Amycolatopsis sp. H20-H5 TaxID=3046309 RepID=UPI002DBCAB27|nr:hypothetical protein [Amycolatopsis sp. H20-H5]MEC3981749.1 hypothetical protein [Amycolatopsis sp. H20-H5]
MTYNPAQPARVNTGKSGVSGDVKTFAAALLLTFGSGLLMMVGWALVDSGFGAFLGLVAAGFGIYWWSRVQGKVFPPALSARSVLVLAGINIALAVALLLLVG